MLIEQIIEFQLKGPGPFDRACTPVTNKLHDYIKISKKNLRVDYYISAKVLQKAMCFTSPIDQITYN